MIDPWFSLRLSLIVALIATLLVGVGGTAIGYALARLRFPGKEYVDAICTLPLVLPPTVIGFFLLSLLGKNGCLGQFFWKATGWNPLFTWQAAVIASVVISLPFMIKTSRAAIESVDRTYEHAAYMLGTGRLQAFFRVTAPLAWKGLLAGVALSFTRALGEFGATLMLAGNIPGKTQTMPLAIYQATQTGDDNLAVGLVVILTVTAFASLLLMNRLGAKW